MRPTSRRLLTVIIIAFYSCQPGPSSDGSGKAPGKGPSGNSPDKGSSGNASGKDAGELIRHNIHLQKGIDLALRLPGGYNISVAFEELDRPRFLCKSPDRRLFVTDMFDISDNKEGKVYILDGWDSAARRFSTIHTYLDSLHNPNQVGFYRENGKNYLYIAETGTLTRYVYHDGDTMPAGKPQLIASFPDYGLDYKYGGWHLTRSIAFHDHKLYVSVGSSCNACIEKEDVRATVMEMNPDGSDKHFFATGLRNSVAIKWIGDKLWATYMGRDLIGTDRPQDLFETVERGKFYGWPYYFQDHDTVRDDKLLQDTARQRDLTIPPRPAPAYCAFLAHSAPLGLEYFNDFEDTLLRNSVLVALHGSTDVSLQRGNAIVKIMGHNNYTRS
jgi:glucose/arabinose dehydrogenase